ncbi:MAG TPA: pilin [Candidatus Methylomirabilis sp.]|nr:pilin [Candidatus Methylomirabilis sp.]
MTTSRCRTYGLIAAIRRMRAAPTLLSIFFVTAFGVIIAGPALANPGEQVEVEGDPCSEQAAAQQANIFGVCQLSCTGNYPFDASTVFEKNPCAAVTGKKKCCLQQGNPSCQWAAKKKGGVADTSKVGCFGASKIYTAEIKGTAGSCSTGSTGNKCRNTLPSCTDSVSKLGQSVDAECTYNWDTTTWHTGTYPDAFNAKQMLDAAKITFTCPADTSCYAKAVGTSRDYFCNKLGQLKGVEGAVCARSVLVVANQTPTANYNPCKTLAEHDPKYAGFEELIGSGYDPCTQNGDLDSGGGDACCAPPVKAGKPGAGASATSTKQTKQAPPVTVTKFGLINPLGTRSVPQILGQVVQWLGGIAGSLFFAFLLWGGVQWMTAGGDATKVKNAQQRIVASVTGIVIVLLAYLIVSSLTGVLTFK